MPIYDIVITVNPPSLDQVFLKLKYIHVSKLVIKAQMSSKTEDVGLLLIEFMPPLLKMPILVLVLTISPFVLIGSS